MNFKNFSNPVLSGLKPKESTSSCFDLATLKFTFKYIAFLTGFNSFLVFSNFDMIGPKN